MEQYERAIKNLKTARSEHVAVAQLIITSGKFDHGSLKMTLKTHAD